MMYSGDQPMRRFRVRPHLGVVGLGYWGPNLVRVLFERGDVDVRWICDQDEERLSVLGRRYPAVRQTTDIEQLLDDPLLDGIVLATPVQTHYELAKRCMAAGKNVFVEKPLAASTAEATDLIDTATRSGLVLMCGHTFLCSPPVNAVKDLIEDGALGDIYFISSSRVNLGLHQRDVSVIWDLGPHDFSILLYWLGTAPRTVRASGRDSIVPGIADVAFVGLEFSSGVIANVELSWLAPSKLRRTVIVGSRKMVVYDDSGPEPVKIYDRGVDYKDPDNFGEWQLSYRSGDIHSPHLPSHEPLAIQAEHFVRAIATGELPEHGCALALEVVRCAEAAQASLVAGGINVELESDFDQIARREMFSRGLSD
jgi:predicted dehydrogenase